MHRNTSIPLGKQLVITCNDGVITNPHRDYINEELSPCDHEEADSRMILHVDDILITARSVVVRTVDTDVLVLAIAASARHKNKEIWVSFGTGSNKKIFSAHDIKEAIGTVKAVALPVFHAFTGCDTVSAFRSIGKKTAWKRWKDFDSVTEAFTCLSNGPPSINPQTETLLERFTVLLYDRISPCTSVNELRKELFTRGRPIECIPPTSESFIQHNRRAAFQGGHIWGKSNQKLLQLPDASNWGWMKDKLGSYVPFWTSLPIASIACSQLAKCGFKRKNEIFICCGNCTCVKMRQSCTELCKCKGKCSYSQKLKNREDDECNWTKRGVENEQSASGSESEGEEENLFEIDVLNVDFDADIDILFDDDF